MKTMTVSLVGVALMALMALMALVQPLAGQLSRSPTAAPQPDLAVSAPAPWLQQDPADSLYREGRRALNDGDYRAAARYFRQIRQRYAESGYVADAHYWEAFARFRLDTSGQLKQALVLLEGQLERYPDAQTTRDARDLRARIRGRLAQRGDADAAERIATRAAQLAPPAPRASPAPRARQAPRAAPAPRARLGPRARRYQDDDCDDDDDERLLALNALLQMRADQAVPILQRVLERRDEGSLCLRRKAVFLVSQKRSPETARILLNVVRSDPDQEVREQAVFWLSQVNTAEATAALDSILQNSSDVELQEKAVFALSQQRSPAASRALRDHLERDATPSEIKENIIFWLGQRRSEENAEYLRQYYASTDDAELKEKIIFSLSQMSLEENARWIMSIALDENETIDVRKNALFWAGQMNAVNIDDLVGLYDGMTDLEMKEHLVFVYSQRRESAAVDKLIDIGRNETNRELRGKAIFWLGQSRDPRAADFLLEIINR